MAQLLARPLCEKMAFSGRKDPTHPWKRCTTCWKHKEKPRVGIVLDREVCILQNMVNLLIPPQKVHRYRGDPLRVGTVLRLKRNVCSKFERQEEHIIEYVFRHLSTPSAAKMCQHPNIDRTALHEKPQTHSSTLERGTAARHARVMVEQRPTMLSSRGMEPLLCVYRYARRRGRFSRCLLPTRTASNLGLAVHGQAPRPAAVFVKHRRSPRMHPYRRGPR